MSSEYSTEEDYERPKRMRTALENTPSTLPLWRLFREALLNGGACRDIVEKHVMCKLNGTDLKFFYEVNTETRKLVKRSSRAGDLKKRFRVSEMSSISTLEVAWENKSLWPSGGDETFSARKLLERINSSCSSGRERRKSVSGMNGRLMRPQNKVIWKWSSIAWQISVLSIGGRVQMLPKTVISRYSNTYAKKRKRLGIVYCRLGG